MLKKIIIIIIPFLLTGCGSVKYDLNIEKDLTVSETSFMTATADYFNLFFKNYPITIVEGVYELEENKLLFTNNGYTYDLVRENIKYPGILVTKKYNNLNDYSNQTIFKGQTFEEINVTTNDNLVTLKTKNFLPVYLVEEIDDRRIVSELEINIKLPFVVTNHNADNYDKKTNTYSWYIKEDTEDKEIELTFDKNKKYVYNLVMYISLSILILLGVIGIIIGIMIVKKNKRNNIING